MHSRPASHAELLDRYKNAIKYGWRTSYRHGISERLNPRARNGVSHVEYSKAALIVKDDGLYVRRHRKLNKLVASVWVMDDGREHVMDLREEWLKPGL